MRATASSPGRPMDSGDILAKQMREAARARRVVERLERRRQRREVMFPFWTLLFGLTIIVGGLAVTMQALSWWRI
jgi:hypothetical protein